MSMLEQGQEAQVVSMCQATLKKRPTDALSNQIMAMVHGAYSRDAEALPYIQRAAYAMPKDGSVRFMLANVLMSLKKYKESAGAYRECLRIAPGDVAACDGLAKCYISMGQVSEAKRVYESAITAHPEDHNTYGNYGNALQVIGRVAEALEVGKRGLARFPEDPVLLEFVTFSANYPMNADDAEIRGWHERLGRAYVGERSGTLPVFLSNKLEPERALRVGFVSGDYSIHACSFFLRGLLTNFHAGAVIAYCYSTARHTDGGDVPFRAVCQFRDCEELNSDQLAATVRRDEIDILIDCAGLTQGQRLRAFVPRAAPIQCTWLGYPNTTGLPTMDYRIVDAWTDPPGSEHHCTERLARITRADGGPGCFLCYTPLDGMPRWEAASRADASEPGIVFGSFNRMMKVTSETLDAWCAVLKAVPDSKMNIKLRIATKEMTDDTLAMFTSRGVSADRILLSPYAESAAEHQRMYSRIDIALDAFPYNGTTTTCEAMWMGVPVVVLEGTNHRGRVGVSLLHAVGVPELVAPDIGSYISIAAGLAADRRRLYELKASLRERMAGSILCDAPGYARRYESLLRELWVRHCATQPSPS